MSLCLNPEIFLRNTKMSRPQVNVVDVYEMATDMGKEIERMVHIYGVEAMTLLVPKVITTLELLETFAAINEDEHSQIDDLKSKVEQLESEKIGKAEDRLKHEKELEQLEENLRDENNSLIDLVSRLQDENRKLRSSLAERDDINSEPDNKTEPDLLVFKKLKQVLEDQKKQLRIKEQEVQQKSLELETAQSQLDRLSHFNKELHRKQRNSQLQARALIEEKAELQAQLQDQQRELQALRDNLGATMKTNEDLLMMKSPTMPNLRNKQIIYDVDDPDRPRFTMSELRRILLERNELKAKVSELMDELELYRPKPASPSKFSEDDQEQAVQGPINRDPDDAPWKKRDSGIRKLFRSFFGDSSDSPKL